MRKQMYPWLTISDQVIDIFPGIVPMESLLFKYAQVHICYFSAS